MQTFVCSLMTMSLLLPISAKCNQVDRQGVGSWCYDPIRSPTPEEKASFVAEVTPAAIAAERKWGVPAPIIAAMTIVESGYGLTRLAIKSNNILSFKWPGKKIAGNLEIFKLWCQPPEDKGNLYIKFKTHEEAIDFVSSRLSKSPLYAPATAEYMDNIKKGKDRKTAAQRWLSEITKKYNWNPDRYISDINRTANNPIGDGSLSLWSLEP